MKQVKDRLWAQKAASRDELPIVKSIIYIAIHQASVPIASRQKSTKIFVQSSRHRDGTHARVPPVAPQITADQ